MKRLFLGCLVFAAGLYFGAVFMVGGQVRDRYFAELQNAGRYGFLSFSNLEYERGLFSSSARTLVSATLPEGGEGREGNSTFTVRHVFHHGPLPAPFGGHGFKPSLALVESRAEARAQDGRPAGLFAQFPELGDTSAIMRIGFDGAVEGDLAVPAFDRTADGERLASGGLQGRFQYDQATGAVRGELSAPTVTLESGEGRVELEGFAIRFDLVEALPLLFVGKVDAGLTNARLGRSGTDEVLVSNLRVASDSGGDGAFVHSRQTLEIGSIVSDGATHGPMTCDLEIRNLDARALSDFQLRLRELSMTSRDADEFTARAPEVYARLFTELAAGSPELRVSRLRLATSMGDVAGSLSVKLDAPGEAAAGNPLLLLRHLEASAELAVAETVVTGLLRMDVEAGQAGGAMGAEEVEALVRQRFSGEIEPLLERNLLARDGSDLKTRAVFSKGSLTVNGQEMPLF
jgi:uncharacterized protein YdgA (DUF945 family)